MPAVEIFFHVYLTGGYMADGFACEPPHIFCSAQ